MTKTRRKDSATNEMPAAQQKGTSNAEIVLGVLAHTGKLRRDIAPLLNTQDRERTLEFADRLDKLAEELQTASRQESLVVRMRIASVLMQISTFTDGLAVSLPIRTDDMEPEIKEAA